MILSEIYGYLYWTSIDVAHQHLLYIYIGQYETIKCAVNV